MESFDAARKLRLLNSVPATGRKRYGILPTVNFSGVTSHLRVPKIFRSFFNLFVGPACTGVHYKKQFSYGVSSLTVISKYVIEITTEIALPSSEKMSEVVLLSEDLNRLPVSRPPGRGYMHV